MTVPLILELKKMLTEILNSDKVELRKRGMRDAMELMTQLEMYLGKAEAFLKTEDIKKGNEIINDILDDVNKIEYGKK